MAFEACSNVDHDDVTKWKHFPPCWPFVRLIHRSPVNSPRKGQWRGALMFSLICAWINLWLNNREVGGLRRPRVHYGVIVMYWMCREMVSVCQGVFFIMTLHRRHDISSHHTSTIISTRCSSWQHKEHQSSALTVYPKKYAHGFVVLCFDVVIQSFLMNSHEVFIHIHQGCFAGTGAIVRLPQCQWSKPDGYETISQFITTTKHSKAKTVYIFLGIYCNALCEGTNKGSVLRKVGRYWSILVRVMVFAWWHQDFTWTNVDWSSVRSFSPEGKCLGYSKDIIHLWL